MFTKTTLVTLALGAQLSLAAPVRSDARALIGVQSNLPLFGGPAKFGPNSVLGGSLGGYNNKRGSLSGLMVDTETGTIYAQVPDANTGRSIKAIEGIAKDIFGKRGEQLDARSLRAISSVLGGLFGGDNNKRDGLSGVMVDTETGTLFMDVPDAVDARSFRVIGSVLNGLLGGGDSDSSNSKRAELDERSFRVIGNVLGGLLGGGDDGNSKRDELDTRSFSAIKNIAEELFKRDVMVDTETGTLFMDVPDAVNARSFRVIGSVLNGLLGGGDSDSSNSKRAGLDERSFRVISGALSGLLGGGDDSNSERAELDTRSLKAIEGIANKLFGKRSELEESMAKRAIDDLE